MSPRAMLSRRPDELWVPEGAITISVSGNHSLKVGDTVEMGGQLLTVLAVTATTLTLY